MEMTVPSRTARPIRGTAIAALRHTEVSCAMPTSSIRSRLTMTTPQPRPITAASSHGAPSDMCTANVMDSAASAPVLSSTPPSATYFEREPGATESTSSRAPASEARRSPTERLRADMQTTSSHGFCSKPLSVVQPRVGTPSGGSAAVPAHRPGGGEREDDERQPGAAVRHVPAAATDQDGGGVEHREQQGDLGGATGLRRRGD